VGGGGKGRGRKWEKVEERKMAKGRVFPAFSHHFPGIPKFSHLNFYLLIEQKIRPPPAPSMLAMEGGADRAVHPGF